MPSANLGSGSRKRRQYKGLAGALRRTKIAIASAASAAMLLGQYATASTDIWSNGAKDGLWDTGANWGNGASPISTDDVTFTVGNYNNILLGSGEVANSLTFNDSNYYLTGGSLTLGAGNITVNTPFTDTISSTLNGSSGLTFAGGGTLNLLNTSNGFTGTVAISGSTLNIAADGSLGTSTNGITFSGTSTLNLLNGGTFLGANRTVTLGAAATTDTITSSTNGIQTLAGQITGAANLTLTNTGPTLLANSTNNFTGALWIQNGTAVVNSLTDAPGNGNIRLGNGGSTGVFQWGTAAAGPLTFNNRQIELVGTTGSGTIDSSAAVQANTVTINTNLLISTNGAKTLTLQGSNAGNQSVVSGGAITGAANTFAGTIGDSGSGATSLTKSGSGLWVLNGVNTYSGLTTINAGTLRLTNANSWGASGNFAFGNTFGLTLELRNDSSTNFLRSMSANGANGGAAAIIYVDRALGGTGSNGTMTLGNITQTNSTASFDVFGDHGYGLTTGLNTLTGAATKAQTFFIVNDLGAPGTTAGGFQAGLLTLGGITNDTTADLSNTFTVSGWGNTFINGSISSVNGANTATPLNFTNSATGLLTFSGASNANWTVGTLTLSAGTTRLTAGTNPIGSATITFNGGMLELRNDTNTNFASNIAGVLVTSTLVLDHTLGATATTDQNATTTLGNLTIGVATKSTELFVAGDRGNSLIVGGTTTLIGNSTNTLGNFLAAPGYSAVGYTPGTIKLGSLTNDPTAGTANLTLAGFGDYALAGNITNANSATVALAITKTGQGVLTFGGSNTGWTGNVGDVLTLTSGTTRLTGASPIGSATITLNGGLLELRNDASTNVATNISGVTATSTLLLDHSIGNTTDANFLTTIGTLNSGTGGTLNVVGDRGYGLTVSGATTVVGTKTLTLANFLSAPGYSGASYTPGIITLTNVNGDGTAGVSTVVLSGFGDFNAFDGTTNIISAGVGNTAGTTDSLNITKSNLGVVTFSGNNANWTSTAQGILLTTLGTTRIDAANTNAIGGANLSLGGGMTEIRSNVSTSWSSHNLTLNNAASTLVIAPEIGSSNTGNTVALGTFTGAGNTVSVDTNHNYGLTFTAGTASASSGIANIGNGLISLASLTNSATSTYTFSGNGDFAVTGNILAGTGTTALTKTGFGTLTLSGTGDTYTGAITLTAGILKITNPLGAATGGLTFNNTGSGIPNNNVIAVDLRNNGNGLNNAGASVLDISTHPFSRTINIVFNVDNNGAGTNGTVVVGGGMSMQDSAWNILVMGGNGYSLKFAGSAVTNSLGANTGGSTYTVFNYIPSIAGSGDLEFAGGLTYINPVAQTASLTLSGTGDYLVSGAITSSATTAAGATTLIKSGLGTLTLSGDNSTSYNDPNRILTMSGGITRASTAANLGGTNTTLNLNGGVLDLRNDLGQTFTETVAVGASNSTINVDQAIGGSGTGQTMTLGGLKVGAVTAFFTNGNNYSLNTGTLTQTGTNTIVNKISGTGSLFIPSIGGTQATTFTGSGSTIVSGPAASSLGAITKSGTGSVTFQEPTAGANTTGNLIVNAGSLVADYSNGITNSILTATDTLTFAGGAFQLKSSTTASTPTSQTLGNVTVNAGGGTITVTPQNGNTTTLNAGTLATTALGSTLLVNSDTVTGVVNFNSNLATIGGRVVLFDGANYNWATNSGVNSPTTAFTGYTNLPSSGTTSTTNYLQTDSISVTSGGTLNTLKITTTQAGQSLSLTGATTTLIFSSGGLLFTGANDYTISSTDAAQGLKSGIVTNSDFIISQYGTGKLTINAPILHGAGTDSLTIAGTGTVILGGTLGANLNTYTGTTFVNGGTLQLANATQLGANVTSNGLTINGGTFDLNGNNVNIAGAVVGGYSGTIDNSGAAATLTVGSTFNNTVSILGTIKNSGSPLSIVKAGTGAMTLGDVNGMSSLAFTGDLSITGNSTVTVAVPLTDIASTKVNLGTPTSTDNPNFNYTGNANLILNSRQFDLGNVSNGTINGSGVNGINGTPGVLVINSNLLLDGTGNKTLTLGGTAGALAPGGAAVSGITGSGSVATINTFAGTIGVNNPNSITLGLTIAGSGGWALTGANTFSGGLTMNGTGVLRGTIGNGATNGSFGGSGNTITWSAAGQLDLRSDTSQNFGNPISWGNAALKINVDRAPGGDGYGQVMTLGAVTETVSGQTLTATNAVGIGQNNNGTNPVGGYGLRIAGLVLNAGTATTISNGIGGASTAQFATPAAGSSVAGALVIDGITTATNLTHTLTITAQGNSTPVTIITGDVVQSSGTSLGINFTGNNLLTLSGQTANTNYSGGVTINNGSGGTVRATTFSSLGSGTVTLTNGNLELRNDSSTIFGWNGSGASAVPISWSAANSVNIQVGEAINGTGGHNNTFTLGTVTIGNAGVGKTLTVSGISGSSNNSGDSVTLGNITLSAGGTTITNNLLQPGVLMLGNENAGTAVSVLGSGTLAAGTTLVSGVTNFTNLAVGQAVTGTGIAAGTIITAINTNSPFTFTMSNAASVTGATSYTAVNNVQIISGSGVTTIGDLSNGTSGGTLGVIYSGSGILDLGRLTSASNFTGGFKITGGTVRAELTSGTNFDFGPSSNVVTLGGGTVEFRSDTNASVTNPMNLFANTSITLGQLPGGTGTTGGDGNTISLGAITGQTTGTTLTVGGIGASTASSGYSLTFPFVANQLANTITNNLLLPGLVNISGVTSTATTGTNVLTLNGAGFYTLGNVSNGTGSAVTAITYSGTGVLDLSSTTSGNTYTGGLTISGGTVRASNTATSTAPLGAGTLTLGGGTLEIRSDTSVAYNNPITFNASTGLNIGQLPGGTNTVGGYGNTITLGAITSNSSNSGKNLTIGGIGGSTATEGYSVVIPSVTLAGITSTIITNNLLQPGTLTIQGITSASNVSVTLAATPTLTSGSNTVLLTNTAGLAVGQTVSGTNIPSGSVITSIANNVSFTMTAYATGAGTGTYTAVGNILTIQGPGVTSITGNITNGSGITGLALSNGQAIVDLSGATSNTTNYTGSLYINTGLARLTTPFGLGASTNPVIFGNTGAALEIRSDTDVTYNNPIIVAGNAPISVGQLAAGSGGYGRTITLGAISTAATNGRTLTFSGIAGSSENDGYSVVVPSININNVAALTISNNLGLPGTLSIGGLQTVASPTILSTFTISGAGVTNITGDITGGANMAVSYNAAGVLSLSNQGAGTTYTGGLTINGGGTVRINPTTSTPSALGPVGNTLTLQNGTLDVRSDVNVNIANTNVKADGTSNFTINADRAIGGSGTGGTLTFANAFQITSAATARIYSFTSGDGYNITLNGGVTSATASATNEITGSTSGVLTLGSGLAGNVAYQNTENTAVTTQKFSGIGRTVIAGDILQGGATGVLTVGIGGTTNGGFVDLTAVNIESTTPANAYTGGLTFFGGSTAKIAAAVNAGLQTGAGINFSVSGATLQVRDQTTTNNATIPGFNNSSVTLLTGNTDSLDLGSGNGHTGNTVAFGALISTFSNTTVASTLNVNGINAYGASFSSATLPSGTGQNTIIVGNIPTTIIGNVSNPMTQTVTGHFDPLSLDGVSTGNMILGAIQDNGVGSLALNLDYTTVIKQGLGTWTLAGQSTYTGSTTVNAGTLRLVNAVTPPSLANTAVSVAAAGTFAPGANSSIGVNSPTNLGATLTLAAGAKLNLATDGVAGSFTILGNGTFVGTTQLTLAGNALSFDLGSAAGDEIFVGSATGTGKAVATGANSITLNVVAGTTSLLSSYTLIQAGTGSTLQGGGAFTLTNPTLIVGSNVYVGSLSTSTATAEILTFTSTTGVFWAHGNSNTAPTASWNDNTGPGGNTNFSNDAAATSISTVTPTSGTNVIFTASSGVTTPIVTTLDNNFEINSLTFSGTGTSNTAGSSIGPGSNSTNTLQIDAGIANSNPLGNGISVVTGSGANTISANVVLGGVQTWTVSNLPTNPLTVSGVVSGVVANTLTKAGTGTLTLSGNNTFAGGLTLSAGLLNINAQGTVSPSSSAIGTGPLTLTGGTINTPAGAIDLTSTTNNLQTWSDGGSVAFTGTNTLNLGTGAVTLGTGIGATFTLTNNSALAGTSLTVGGTITGGTGGTGGVKTLAIGGAGSTALTGNITKGATATGVIITDTSSGTLTLSGTSAITTLNMNGGPNSIVNLGTGSLTFSNNGLSFIQASQGGTINGTGTAGIVLNSKNGGSTVDFGDNGTPSGFTLTINAKVTGGFGFEVYGGNGSTGVVVLTNMNTFTGDVNIDGGILSVGTIGNTGSVTSNMGAGTNISINNGTATTNFLRYTGGGETTNRVINLYGTTGGGGIDQEGTGPLKFTANLATPGAGAKTFFLFGSPANPAVATGEIAGIISDNSPTNKTSVSKLGTGTWILSGANSYTGTTSVGAGKLVVNGSLAAGSAVTVADLATLDGTGTVFGSATLASGTQSGGSPTSSGGTIAAGAGAVGKLTVATATFGSASPATGQQTTYKWKFTNADLSNGLGTNAGTFYDTLSITTLSVTGAVDVVASAITPVALDPNMTYQFKIISGTGPENTTGAATLFHLDASSYAAFGSANLATATSDYSFSGDSSGDVFINYSAAPEPTSMMLLGLGVGGLAMRRRRRRVKADA